MKGARLDRGPHHLSREDEDQLMAHLAAKAPTLVPLATAFIHTGMRLAEAMSLRWEDVRNMPARRITICRHLHDGVCPEDPGRHATHPPEQRSDGSDLRSGQGHRVCVSR